MEFNSINDFSSKVLSYTYAAQSSDGNLAFSGVSLYLLMATINIGLRGRTSKQLSNLLHEDFTDLQNQAVWQKSALAKKYLKLREYIESGTKCSVLMFHSCGIKQHFLHVSETLFGLEKMHIDRFNSTDAVMMMNAIIEALTDGLIKKLFDEPLDRYTTILFVNTLLFNQDWFEPFDKSDTKSEKFHDGQGNILFVDMMMQESSFPYFDDVTNGVEYLFMPYKQEGLWAVIVLPKEGYSIKDMMKNYSLNTMQRMFRISKSKTIELKLPKFEIRSKIDLIPAFLHHDVKDLFTTQVADIGGITDQTGFISKLQQVAVVIVNEQGTQAAAVTEGRVEADSATRPKRFFVDRPFLFIIYLSEYNVCLFSVIVTNPNKGQ